MNPSLKNIVIAVGLFYIFAPHMAADAWFGVISHHNLFGFDASLGLEHGMHQYLGAGLVALGIFVVK